MNPRTEILKLLSIPAVLILLSYLGFLAVEKNYLEEVASQNEKPLYRTPSNFQADDQKMAAKKILSTQNFKKPHGSLEVEISNQNLEPLIKDQPIELLGTVTASRDLAQVDVVWHLPEGVERVGGIQRQSLSNLRAGETQKVSIQIVSHSDLNQQIHLEASYQQGVLKIGSTSQFNTLDQQNMKMQSHAKNEGTKIWQ